MTRRLITIIACLILAACSQNNTLESKQYGEYQMIQERLLKQNKFVKSTEFDTILIYNEINKKYRYDLIINNPKNEMKDITALCFVDEENEGMFPNLGIFNEEEYSLKKDYINKEENYYKGIMLSGITLKRGNAKLYISYLDEKNEKQELFIEVFDEIR